MADLSIPDEWTHFQSNWDAYRNVYETFCIFDGHWYKGLGPTREAGVARLRLQIAEGRKGSQLLEPSRYTTAKGAYRHATIPPKSDVFEKLGLTEELDL